MSESRMLRAGKSRFLDVSLPNMHVILESKTRLRNLTGLRRVHSLKAEDVVVVRHFAQALELFRY